MITIIKSFFIILGIFALNLIQGMEITNPPIRLIKNIIILKAPQDQPLMGKPDSPEEQLRKTADIFLEANKQIKKKTKLNKPKLFKMIYTCNILGCCKTYTSLKCLKKHKNLHNLQVATKENQPILSKNNFEYPVIKN